MNTLRFGDTGTEVQILQLALSRVGFFAGLLDGFYDAATKLAVVSFQQSFALTPDGITGPKTWNRLIPYLKGFFVKTAASGDSFWLLADRYHTTVRAIMTANPTIDPQNIYVGQSIVIPLGFNVVPTNISYSSQLFVYIIEGLKARYPFLNIGTIGKSVMGKPLYYLSIGTGNTQVFYTATHHANEWITTPMILKYLEEYAFEYSRGGIIFDTPALTLYNKATLFMVPLVNPDGLDLVTGVLNDGIYYINARTYAGNFPYITFPSGWKANISGIDLNLQYPAGWEQAQEIKHSQGFISPAPRDYVGPSPLAAPESRAIYNFTLNHDFSLILAYHTQGKVIFWKYADYNPPRSFEIAVKMSEASGYLVEETPFASGSAGYKDWFIKYFDKPGYTIEAGIGENPLPITQFDEIYNDNIGILTLGITET